MKDAPSLSIAVMLQVVDLAARFNQRSEGRLEFQVGPVDVFLGARSVLFNRSVTQPTLSMVKELVLDEIGPLPRGPDGMAPERGRVRIGDDPAHARLPDRGGLRPAGVQLFGGGMVMAAGERLARAPALAGRALQTLSDAILFKIQQQDIHKDRQVQGILGHFNRLLRGERRSAQRVSEERQQVRFDYVSAIQRAGDLVKEIQTGQFRAVQPEGPIARPAPGS